MKIFIIATISCIITVRSYSQTTINKIVKSNGTADEKVDLILKQMTLEDKLIQMRSGGSIDQVYKESKGKIGFTNNHYQRQPSFQATQSYNKAQKFIIANNRLGIPAIFYDEAIAGLKNNGATCFPQPLSQASTWNPALIYQMSSAIAKEARTKNIHQVLSPVVNIVRDSRWGRTHETYGEDPYLSGKIGAAFCLGMHDNQVISTPKHFVANQGTAGHNSGSVNYSERLLREIYLPAFKMCIDEGKAQCIMAAYNSVSGIPCSSSKWLLTDLLRKEWNFQGYVISDYGAIDQLNNAHYTAATKEDATLQVLEAGLDVEAPSYNYFGQPLEKLIKQGKITESKIDEVVRRILKVKLMYNLFEKPYGIPDSAAYYADCKLHRALAREIARQGIVLLKNNNDLLPLKENIKIALSGPFADTIILGGYAGWGTKTYSVKVGLQTLFPKSTINTSTGAYFSDMPAIEESCFRQPNDTSKQGLYAEYFNNMTFEGKPSHTRIDNKIDFDWDEESPFEGMNKDFFSIRWAGYFISPATGYFDFGAISDASIRIYLDDKLVVENWDYWATGLSSKKVYFEKNKRYKLKVEYNETEWFANVKLVWNGDLTNKINLAVERAKKADVAIIVVGAADGEGKDRAFLELPKTQELLIEKIAATGTPIVVVLQSGNVIAMGNWIHLVDAVLTAWYPGEEGGNAIAEVLKGQYNPGGKLPITFPLNTVQVPLFYNQRLNGGGSYMDITGDPLFVFGHGLSYTSFQYSNLQLDTTAKIGDVVALKIDIKNTGKMSGDEVVQVYLSDKIASITQPVRKLVAFSRINLKVGETKTISLEIKADQFALWNIDMKQVVEPGNFEVEIGSSSKDIRLKKMVMLNN